MTEAPIDAPDIEPEDADAGEMPRTRFTRREATVLGVFVVAAVTFLYFGLPQIAGLHDTWDRIRDGDPKWLFACLVFELISFGGYVWLFRTVFLRGSNRIDWKAAYEITMAGLAATRLFAAAGAGGAALTVWALRQSGMRARLVATRMVAQYVILYGVYMGSMMLLGIGLYTGVLHGGRAFAITMIPAIIGTSVIAIALAFTLVPTQIDARIEKWAQGSGRTAHLIAKLSKAPAAVSAGVREAITIVRERNGGAFGAIIWWYADIACLWASFHAFGTPPPFFALVMAYFVGMTANLLPLPGGIGGVDGGMIGALIAFGVQDSLAIVSVLTYRAFSFWLPTIPGALAYFQLRKTVQRWKDERAGERAAIQSEVLPVSAR